MAQLSKYQRLSYMSLKEAGVSLGILQITLKRKIARGEVPTTEIGGQQVINRDWVERYLRHSPVGQHGLNKQGERP